ncbi:MAG: hypothetical protein PHP85_05950 [Gallionella sp.]|nr:hypothetical protein [Gallionella sp.]
MQIKFFFGWFSLFIIVCFVWCSRPLPSDREVEDFLVAHNNEFELMVAICKKHVSLEFISSGGDIQTINKIHLNNNEIEDIRRSQLKLEQLGLENLHCLRDGSKTPSTFEIVKFSINGSEGRRMLVYSTDQALEKYVIYIKEAEKTGDYKPLTLKGWHLQVTH